MSIGTTVKDPADVRVYAIDWSEFLGAATIATSTWVLPTGLTNVVDSKTSTVANVKISGGVNGRNYRVANEITTSAGETKRVSIELNVETQ